MSAAGDDHVAAVAPTGPVTQGRIEGLRLAINLSSLLYLIGQVAVVVVTTSCGARSAGPPTAPSPEGPAKAIASGPIAPDMDDPDGAPAAVAPSPLAVEEPHREPRSSSPSLSQAEKDRRSAITNQILASAAVELRLQQRQDDAEDGELEFVLRPRPNEEPPALVVAYMPASPSADDVLGAVALVKEALGSSHPKTILWIDAVISTETTNEILRALSSAGIKPELLMVTVGHPDVSSSDDRATRTEDGRGRATTPLELARPDATQRKSGPPAGISQPQKLTRPGSPGAVAMVYVMAIGRGDWKSACLTRSPDERERMAQLMGSCEEGFKKIMAGKRTHLMNTVSVRAVRIRGNRAEVDMAQQGSPQIVMTLVAVRVRGDWLLIDEPGRTKR